MNTEQKKIIKKDIYRCSKENHLYDCITRIRNGYLAKLSQIKVTKTKLIGAVLEQLRNLGYIDGYCENKDSKQHSFFLVNLKYSGVHKTIPAIVEIVAVSKPSQHIHLAVKDFRQFSKSFCYSGFGNFIISTNQGVLSGPMARMKNVGGKVLLRVF